MTVPLIHGNQVRLLQNGQDYFPALLRAIHSAQTEIYLETYIFAEDETGLSIIAALKLAAQRGVRVHVLIDGFGSQPLIDHSLPLFTDSGIQVRIYRREIRRFSLNSRRLRRLHRKLSVFDGHTAFVGGINIIDDYNNGAEASSEYTSPRFDYAVQVEGPIVASILHTVKEMWRLVSLASFKVLPHLPHRALSALRPPIPPPTHGSMRCALVLRDNLLHRSDIENAYLAAISRAQHSIIIANAYFLPGWRFRHELLQAAQRGVQITLLLQGQVEYWLAHHACQALYPPLLAAGIRIVEYHKSFLHAKVAVIDNNWATVGSSNIDPFSLLLAREANLIIRHPSFATELRNSLLCAMETGGQLLTAEHWQRRSVGNRLINWLAYGVVRLLLDLLGYTRQPPK